MRAATTISVILMLLLGPPAHAADLARSSRLVVALYYPWYDHSTWSSGTTADVPLEEYQSADRAAIERHVSQAREAGIDVLVSAWFGPRDGNPTEWNFQTLLETADQQGLSAALLLETDNGDFFPDRDALVLALRHFLDVHANHPGYLRVDGRPAIFVWNPTSVFAPDGHRVNQKSQAAVWAWLSLLDEVDPDRQALWIAEGEFLPILQAFHGIFPYSVAWSRDPARQLQAYGQQVRAYNARNGTDKLWIATAMPGYDDTRVPGRQPVLAVDRADGAYYRRRSWEPSPRGQTGSTSAASTSGLRAIRSSRRAATRRSIWISPASSPSSSSRARR